MQDKTYTNEVVILFRKDESTENEFNIASKYFKTYESRYDIPNNTQVLCRYSSLPYYEELVEYLKTKNCTLINNFDDYKNVNNIENWYPLLKEYTFKTWFNDEYIGEQEFPVIVKGSINSRKHQWKDLMFADSIEKLEHIKNELRKDSLFDNQDLVVRKYVKLKNSGYFESGLPISNEYRFIIFNRNIVSYGYYWSSVKQEHVEIPLEVFELIRKVKNIIETPFYSIDVAEDVKGNWHVIEIGDGQLSGLVSIDPDTFYKNLKKIADATSMLNLQKYYNSLTSKHTYVLNNIDVLKVTKEEALKYESLDIINEKISILHNYIPKYYYTKDDVKCLRSRTTELYKSIDNKIFVYSNKYASSWDYIVTIPRYVSRFKQYLSCKFDDLDPIIPEYITSLKKEEL